jgi:hypothetical protein
MMEEVSRVEAKEATSYNQAIISNWDLTLSHPILAHHFHPMHVLLLSLALILSLLYVSASNA